MSKRTKTTNKRSRKALDVFEAGSERYEWWDDYAKLRDEEIDWRVAAYIAWAACPRSKRWPTALKDLATDVLNVSASVVHRWRRMNPWIDKRVEEFGIDMLRRRQSDVIDAWITVASTPDPKCFADREAFLQKMGLYVPKRQTVFTGSNDGPIGINVSNDDIDTVIESELARLAERAKAGNAHAANAS
jgi:hypothetical protein